MLEGTRPSLHGGADKHPDGEQSSRKFLAISPTIAFRRSWIMHLSMRRAVSVFDDRRDPIISPTRPAFAKGDALSLQRHAWLSGRWRVGPMLGQHGHFLLYAQEKIPYGLRALPRRGARLYRCSNTQLGKTGSYIAGDIRLPTSPALHGP